MRVNSLPRARVCNPGLTEPENPGNPDFFQTRHPGLNGLPNPGFRVWFFYFSLCCFIVICVSLWVHWFNKTTTYKGGDSLTQLSINLSSSQAVKCVCVCERDYFGPRTAKMMGQVAKCSLVWLICQQRHTQSRTYAIQLTPITLSRSVGSPRRLRRTQVLSLVNNCVV